MRLRCDARDRQHWRTRFDKCSRRCPSPEAQAAKDWWTVMMTPLLSGQRRGMVEENAGRSADVDLDNDRGGGVRGGEVRIG